MLAETVKINLYLESMVSILFHAMPQIRKKRGIMS